MDKKLEMLLFLYLTEFANLENLHSFIQKFIVIRFLLSCTFLFRRVAGYSRMYAMSSGYIRCLAAEYIAPMRYVPRRSGMH